MENPRKKPPFPVFLAASVVIFFLSLSAADSVGFVPYYIDGTSPRDSVALSNLPTLGEEQGAEDLTEPESEGVTPTRISIPSIDLDLKIQNPNTRDIEALDALLVNGPARYVDSALLAQKGNIVIFAHSSHLPVVHNQMYKAFNRVPELKEGDTITLTGDGKEYIYRVTSVSKQDTSDGVISLEKKGQKLTLVTCDTLTGKSARYVLEAEFVGTN